MSGGFPRERDSLMSSNTGPSHHTSRMDDRTSNDAPEASLFVASLHAFHSSGGGSGMGGFEASSDEEDGLVDDRDLRASETNIPGPNSYKLYKERWMQLGLFCAFSASSGMEWLSFSPISPLFQHYYSCSSFSVTSFSILFMLLYILLAIPAGKFLKESGLRDALCAGAVLNALGAFLKMLPWPFSSGWDAPGTAYVFALLGTICCAIAQLVILPSPVLIAQAWFGAHERVTATALGTGANALGWAISFALVPITLGSHGADILLDEEQARSIPLPRLLLAHFLLASGVTYLVLKHFSSRPPTPPSFSAAVERGEAVPFPTASPVPIPANRQRETPLVDAHQAIQQAASLPPPLISSPSSLLAPTEAWLRLLSSSIADHGFHLVCVSFSVTAGMNFALVVLLGHMLTVSCSDCGLSSGIISVIGCFSVLFGLFSNVLLGHIADRVEWRKHKKIGVWICLAIATAGMVLFMVIPWVEAGSNLFVLFVMIVLGISLNAPEAILLDLGVENTYPAPAEITIQFLLVLGNLVGIVLILILSLFQALSLSFAAFLCVLVLLAPTFTWRGYDGEHKRYDSEIQQQRIADLHVGFTPTNRAQQALDGKQSSYQGDAAL